MPPPKATEAHISIIIIIRWRALQRAQPSQHVDAILDNPVSAHTRLSSSPGRVVGGQFDGTDQTWNRVTFCDPVTRGSHRPGDPVDPLTQY